MTDRVLKEGIEVLRHELERMVEQGASLQDPRVMEISMRLDTLIARYLRPQVFQLADAKTNREAARAGRSS